MWDFKCFLQYLCSLSIIAETEVLRQRCLTISFDISISSQLNKSEMTCYLSKGNTVQILYSPCLLLQGSDLGLQEWLAHCICWSVVISTYLCGATSLYLMLSFGALASKARLCLFLLRFAWGLKSKDSQHQSINYHTLNYELSYLLWCQSGRKVWLAITGNC